MISKAEYANIIKRIDELEGDHRHMAHIGALRKEMNDLNKDFFLEVAKGNIAGHRLVNKFGNAPSGVQTTTTDLWARADSTTTQQIWLAPTAARIHTISSDSASDTTGSTGANSVTIWYLPDWDTAEAQETVTGNLNSGVAMSNAAVIINRMAVNPQSTSTTSNAGTIIATAATDSTITAAILPGKGKTQHAIYGIPSTETAYMINWSGSIDKSQGTSSSCDLSVSFNPNPDVQTTVFLREQDVSVQSDGTSLFNRRMANMPIFAGPGIIKIQAIGYANDLDVQSDFDLILIENGV